MYAPGDSGHIRSAPVSPPHTSSAPPGDHLALTTTTNVMKSAATDPSVLTGLRNDRLRKQLSGSTRRHVTTARSTRRSASHRGWPFGSNAFNSRRSSSLAMSIKATAPPKAYTASMRSAASRARAPSVASTSSPYVRARVPRAAASSACSVYAPRTPSAPSVTQPPARPTVLSAYGSVNWPAPSMLMHTLATAPGRESPRASSSCTPAPSPPGASSGVVSAPPRASGATPFSSSRAPPARAISPTP
mmetsp:Transcript_9476/g.38937  ORF Transcript_9476/g.38937 Transcript_9476/m.38937 type:complete len:246 (-) Transcript_9476:19-756(-)